MRRPRSDEEIALPPGVDPAAGFWWCWHCKRVVVYSEAQENAIEASPLGLNVGQKCPHCHHVDVWWRLPSPKDRQRTQPSGVSLEQGSALFAALKADLANRG